MSLEKHTSRCSELTLELGRSCHDEAESAASGRSASMIIPLLVLVTCTFALYRQFECVDNGEPTCTDLSDYRVLES